MGRRRHTFSREPLVSLPDEVILRSSKAEGDTLRVFKPLPTTPPLFSDQSPPPEQASYV